MCNNTIKNIISDIPEGVKVHGYEEGGREWLQRWADHLETLR